MYKSIVNYNMKALFNLIRSKEFGEAKPERLNEVKSG